MGVNADALKAACQQYEDTLRLDESSQLADDIREVREAHSRVQLGLALSAEQQELLVRAVVTKIGSVKRDSGSQVELLEALERTRQGLEAWPVLSPLSAAADIPVPKPTRHVIDIDR